MSERIGENSWTTNMDLLTNNSPEYEHKESTNPLFQPIFTSKLVATTRTSEFDKKINSILINPNLIMGANWDILLDCKT